MRTKVRTWTKSTSALFASQARPRNLRRGAGQSPAVARGLQPISRGVRSNRNQETWTCFRRERVAVHRTWNTLQGANYKTPTRRKSIDQSKVRVGRDKGKTESRATSILRTAIEHAFLTLPDIKKPLLKAIFVRHNNKSVRLHISRERTRNLIKKKPLLAPDSQAYITLSRFLGKKDISKSQDKPSVKLYLQNNSCLETTWFDDSAGKAVFLWRLTFTTLPKFVRNSFKKEYGTPWERRQLEVQLLTSKSPRIIIRYPPDASPASPSSILDSLLEGSALVSGNSKKKKRIDLPQSISSLGDLSTTHPVGGVHPVPTGSPEAEEETEVSTIAVKEKQLVRNVQSRLDTEAHKKEKSKRTIRQVYDSKSFVEERLQSEEEELQRFPWSAEAKTSAPQSKSELTDLGFDAYVNLRDQFIHLAEKKKQRQARQKKLQGQRISVVLQEPVSRPLVRYHQARPDEFDEAGSPLNLDDNIVILPKAPLPPITVYTSYRQEKEPQASIPVPDIQYDTPRKFDDKKTREGKPRGELNGRPKIRAQSTGPKVRNRKSIPIQIRYHYRADASDIISEGEPIENTHNQKAPLGKAIYVNDQLSTKITFGFNEKLFPTAIPQPTPIQLAREKTEANTSQRFQQPSFFPKTFVRTVPTSQTYQEPSAAERQKFLKAAPSAPESYDSTDTTTKPTIYQENHIPQSPEFPGRRFYRDREKNYLESGIIDLTIPFVKIEKERLNLLTTARRHHRRQFSTSTRLSEMSSPSPIPIPTPTSPVTNTNPTMSAPTKGDSYTSTHPMVWIDCEMTGLDHTADKIIQIVCYITSYDLEILEPAGFERIISRPKSLMDGMDEWCTTTHASTGLTKKVLDSETAVPAEDAARDLLAYIKRFVPNSREGMMSGNSIHADRLFMLQDEYFKEVAEYLNYRLGDVSAIKEMAKRWCPPGILRQAPVKTYTHEARMDVLESIEEARFYQRVLFRNARLPEKENDKDAAGEGTAKKKTWTFLDK